MLAVSLTLFLYSYGYGGITSFAALYADRSGVHPKGIYLTVLAGAILVSRPLFVPMAQRIGHRRVFLPCLVLIAAGMAVLSVGGARIWLVISAIVFGLGFGTAYPVFAAYVMAHVDPRRRARGVRRHPGRASTRGSAPARSSRAGWSGVTASAPHSPSRRCWRRAVAGVLPRGREEAAGEEAGRMAKVWSATDGHEHGHDPRARAQGAIRTRGGGSAASASGRCGPAGHEPCRWWAAVIRPRADSKSKMAAHSVALPRAIA